MKNFSLKALGATLLAAGLVLAGVVAPASAANMTSASISATNAIGTTGTNTSPITITATTVSTPPGGNPTDAFYVDLPTGWTFASTFGGPTCNANTVTQTGLGLAYCSASNTGTPRMKIANESGGMPTSIPAGTQISVTFAVGFLNVASARVFSIGTSQFGGAGVLDTATVTLGGGSSSSTVTFDANGGSGSMTAQTGSAAAALTANSFTRSGYTFAGWNTAANGTGTAYADAASYSFASNVTLYAQWTPTLANTGFDGAPYLSTGAVLALAGVVLMLFARRRQNR